MTPEGWRRDTVGGALLAQARIGWKGLKKSDFTSDGPYLITGIHFRGDGSINWNTCFHIPQWRYDESPEVMVRQDDILLTKDGTIGKVVHVRELPGLAALNSHLYLLRPRTRDLLPRFVYYVLQTDQFRDFVGLNAAGSTIIGLPWKTFRGFALPIPPVGEQRKIAAILSSADDAIGASQAVIDQLQVVKKAMMAELLTKGLPGRHKKFKQTEIGEVPEGWSIRPLADVVAPGTSVTYGIVQAGPHVEGGVPYIKTGDVKPEGIDPSRLARTSPEIASRFERSCVRTGDLVFCIRASVGAVARVPLEIDGANLTQGTARIAPGPAVDGDYLLWALRSPAVQSWVDMQCKGSTFREITLGRLRELPVPVASAAEQAAISCALTAVETRIRNEAATHAALVQVKSALMSVLLTGEVRVRVDEEAAA